MGDALKLSIPTGTDPKGNSALNHHTENSIAQGLQLSDDKKRIKELEKSIADLEKLNAEQNKPAGASKPAAPGKTRHVAHAKGWNAICTEPDLCKVGKDIVAFDSFATLDKQHKASPNVKAHDTPVYRKGDMIKGVQADAGKHITSGTSQGGGHVKILDGHNNVKVNNIPIARHDSICMINCDDSGNGGAKGKLVTEQKSVSASATPAAKASNPEAPPGQRSSEKLERLKDAKSKLEAGQLDLNALDEYVNFNNSNSQLDGLIGQIQGTPGSASDYAAQATRGVLGFVKDGVMGIGELAYEGIKAVPKIGRSLYTSSGQALSQLDAQILAENINLGNITASTIGQGALDIGKAIVKPVTDPWAKGQYVEAGTRAVTEIGTLAFGWIKGSKAAQAAKAAETLKLEEAAKAAKIAEAAKAAELAKAEQMAGAAKSADDGVHVRFRGKIKYRTAADANNELIDKNRVTKDTPPFKEGTTVTERDLVPGERFEMAMDKDQLAKLRDPADPSGVGGWGTKDKFSSQSEALDKLAINPDWKPKGIPKVVEFEVVKPFRTLDGIAGPQGSLAGGGQQYFLDLPRTGAKEFVRVVNVTNLPKAIK